jgi:hypothetical protein
MCMSFVEMSACRPVPPMVPMPAVRVFDLTRSLQAPWSQASELVGLAGRVAFFVLLVLVPLGLIAWYRMAPSETHIQEAALKIHRKVDLLLKNLETAPEKVEALKGEIQQFYQKYGIYRLRHTPALELIDHNKATLNLLESKQDDLWVIFVPAKGDCLFISLLHGLNAYCTQFGWPCPAMHRPEDHLQLRHLLTWYMREHIHEDETLREYTDAAIEAHIFVKTREIQGALEGLALSKQLQSRDPSALVAIDQKIERLKQEEQSLRGLENNYDAYCKLNEQKGFFGSVNAIYAFSRLFPQIHIEVARELQEGFYSKGWDPAFNEKAVFSWELRLKDGNHFNCRPLASK